MIMPVDPSNHRKSQYFLKLSGDTGVQDWRWRFLALDDNDAIDMSVEQLGIVGDSRWVVGAVLYKLNPEGEILAPSEIYRFDVSLRVFVKEYTP